jgi:hypothetical protein
MKILIPILLILSHSVIAGDGEGSGNSPEITPSEDTIYQQVCTQSNNNEEYSCTIVIATQEKDN